MASDSILLVQLADIGDLVLATPAMAALREARPHARIDLFASAHALPCLPDGLLDHVFAFQAGPNASRALFTSANLMRLRQLRNTEYEAVVFLHHFTRLAGTLKFRIIAKTAGARRVIGLQNGRAGFLTESIPDGGFGASHQAQYWLDLLALLGADATPRPARVKREPLACPALSSLPAPRVVIHAGSGGYSLARRWQPERFAALARRLQESHAAQIILVGTGGDDSGALAQMLAGDCLDLTGKTSLPQLADVIATADLFIGADSGVMHIAAATGTALLSIFGPSNSAAWHPWGDPDRAIALRSGVECSPCSYIGHEIGARNGCPARTCMKLVTVDQVARAASQLLDGKPAIPVRHQASPPETAVEAVDVLGFPAHALSYAGWLREIESWIGEGGGARHVCTVNPEFIMIARRDPVFANILRRAALCVPDGVGLMWASRRLGRPLPERVTGSDGVPIIARHAAERGWRLFLLGAADGIAEKTAAVLRARYPGLQVAGVYAGSPAERDEDAIVARVNASGADILLVAYGAPEQDKWIARNLPRLQVAMAMGVGGSFDFIAGQVPRAPAWMRKRGLEWLYRLCRQPWRWKRMLRLPRFAIAVLWQARR